MSEPIYDDNPGNFWAAERNRLVEALAKAEQELAVLRESEAEWQRRGDRALAAEARERELREALRQTRTRIAQKENPFQIMDAIDAALQATQEDS